MAGDGNAPLTTPGDHPDDLTLQEFALGQSEAEQAADVRQHIEQCAPCRARVREWQQFGQRLATDLRHDLDRVTPAEPLDFSPIARQWRVPPKRAIPATFWRLSFPALLLGLLLWMAFWLVSGRRTAALRALDLPEEYDGPPVVLAAATGEGLMVVRLIAGDVRLEQRLSYVTHPTGVRLAPDGEWLAVAQDRVLHIVNTHAGGAHLEIPLAGLAGWAWSPDGSALAYTDGAGQLWLFETQTLSSRLLVPASESAWGRPVWNPDGTQIAYVTARPLPPAAGGATYQSLWRVEVQSNLRVELTRHLSETGALLSAEAWLASGEELLAWETSSADGENLAALYRVDANGHLLTPLDGQMPVQGVRPSWPLGPGTRALVWDGRTLALWHLQEQKKQPLAVQMAWPQAIDWSADGAWLAAVLAGAPPGQGLLLYALDTASVRAIPLPPDATERAVFWAGPEHLFVVRQLQGRRAGEVWLVPLTAGTTPRRIMGGVALPEAGPYNGWRWDEVVALQVLD
jgi:anti-sigma factor RsiW